MSNFQSVMGSVVDGVLADRRIPQAAAASPSSTVPPDLTPLRQVLRHPRLAARLERRVAKLHEAQNGHSPHGPGLFPRIRGWFQSIDWQKVWAWLKQNIIPILSIAVSLLPLFV